jgi:hypothetical protein
MYHYLVIDLEAVSKTVCGMDAAVELTRMYVQRVLKITSRSINLAGYGRITVLKLVFN